MARSSNARRRPTTAVSRDWQGADRDAGEAARLAALYDLDCAPLEGYADVDWFEGLARRTGGPILELGCGTGRIAGPLAPHRDHLVGLDRSTAIVERDAQPGPRGKGGRRWR